MKEKLRLSQVLNSRVGLLAVAMVLLLAVALLSSVSHVRLDLTEGGLYTLSDGTKNILGGLASEEPLQLSFFYSAKVTQEVPAIRAYAKRVEELLGEYVKQSAGSLELKIIDPEPFSEAEDQAAALGLQGVPAGNDDTIYFGLVGEKSDGKQEVIAFFNPEKEEFLEYDISQMIYRLAQEKSLVVGVVSSLPIFQHMNMQTRQREQPKLIMEQIRQLFDVKRMYDTSIDEIDPEIDLLMLVHPHLWPEQTLYAIDQFVLRGGRALVFMDPDAQLDQSEGAMFKGFQDRSSSLEQLLLAWGVSYDSQQVLLDYQFAHSIPVSRYGQALPHLGILGISAAGINRDEAMTANVEQINVGSSGVLFPIQGSATTFTPLLQSSSEAQLISVNSYGEAENHGELLRGFQADTQGPPYSVAALVTGKVNSAFPEGAPKQEGGEAAVEALAKEAEKDVAAIHVGHSKEDIAVVLFADTDILDDRMWVRVQDFFGQQMIVPWAGNGDLIINALEKLSGSVDLISVRSRGTYHRPFTRVDELERKAGEHFREEEERLLRRLEETESKIMALSESVQLQGAELELSVEQQQEVAQFELERLAIRKNLREVQHQLNKDIEDLGTYLKLINIALIPLLLTIFSLLLLFIKSRLHKVSS